MDDRQTENKIGKSGLRAIASQSLESVAFKAFKIRARLSL